MLLVLDDIYSEEFKDYLLGQEGIIDVEIKPKDFISEINVNFNEKLTPMMVMKYIDFFQKDEYPKIIAFDKRATQESKKLNYLVDDMCCEYCYKSLVYELFKNEYIKSVRSNFDFYKPAFNIELIIEYDENYNEEELMKYIKKNL